MKSLKNFRLFFLFNTLSVFIISKQPLGFDQNLVQIISNNKKICTGFLILPDQILTASHCLINIKEENNLSILTKKNERFKIEDVAFPFNPKNLFDAKDILPYGDFAILKISHSDGITPFKFPLKNFNNFEVELSEEIYSVLWNGHFFEKSRVIIKKEKESKELMACYCANSNRDLNFQEGDSGSPLIYSPLLGDLNHGSVEIVGLLIGSTDYLNRKNICLSLFNKKYQEWLFTDFSYKKRFPVISEKEITRILLKKFLLYDPVSQTIDISAYPLTKFSEIKSFIPKDIPIKNLILSLWQSNAKELKDLFLFNFKDFPQLKRITIYAENNFSSIINSERSDQKFIVTSFNSFIDNIPNELLNLIDLNDTGIEARERSIFLMRIKNLKIDRPNLGKDRIGQIFNYLPHLNIIIANGFFFKRANFNTKNENF